MSVETTGINITLTDKAATEVRKFIEGDEQISAATAGLRIGVLPGGCSGFKYSLNIEESAQEDDIILDANGVRVFVDGFSLQYLNGVTIDPTATYQVAINNFLGFGGDGFSRMFDGDIVKFGADDLVALEAYLGANDPYDIADTSVRITRVLAP